jgi:hypothetical protein
MMRDYFTEMYGADALHDPRNWIGGKFKPRKRTVRDREGVNVPMQFVDAARRGYQFDAASPARSVQDAAAEAYEAKRARLQNAWRKNAADDDTPAQCADAAEAGAVADRAWLEKKERLQNSWRLR